MDKSLLIFIAVVILFTYRGYRNGLLKSVGRILGVVAGYICAILFTGSLSGVVAANSALEGIAAFMVASLILFLGAGLAVGILFWFIQRILLRQERISTASSVGGAAVGVLTGVLVAIIIVWAFAFVRDIMPGEESFEFASSEQPAAIEKLANQVASGAVNTALEMGSAEPEVKTISTALFKAPGEVVQQAQSLSKSTELQQLLTDPRNRLVLDSGDPAAVSRLADFKRLAQNPDMQAFMRSSGLLEYAADSNQDAERALAAQLTSVWGRMQRVKKHPRLQEILRDADFQRKVQSGNTLELLSDNRLLELAEIVFGDGEGAAAALAPLASPGTAPTSQKRVDSNDAANKTEPVKKKKKIYTWTDENGKLHISDVKPDS